LCCSFCWYYTLSTTSPIHSYWLKYVIYSWHVLCTLLKAPAMELDMGLVSNLVFTC
jgi:hypothetical protein